MMCLVFVVLVSMSVLSLATSQQPFCNSSEQKPSEAGWIQLLSAFQLESKEQKNTKAQYQYSSGEFGLETEAQSCLDGKKSQCVPVFYDPDWSSGMIAKQAAVTYGPQLKTSDGKFGCVCMGPESNDNGSGNSKNPKYPGVLFCLFGGTEISWTNLARIYNEALTNGAEIFLELTRIAWKAGRCEQVEKRRTTAQTRMCKFQLGEALRWLLREKKNLFDHCVMEEIEQYGSPYLWSAAPFESLHRILQVPHNQFVTNCDARILEREDVRYYRLHEGHLVPPKKSKGVLVGLGRTDKEAMSTEAWKANLDVSIENLGSQ
ncbi:unnamed protein product [Cylicocyclus nassatus]|uniref:Uncharacterized protein n=1 Tax=Cylicocyclus nassatus TaxID=53992 RepID=A0AA36M1Q5_CYLNA|nr:unnamed protein product [Cylicocyclus nassatus]